MTLRLRTKFTLTLLATSLLSAAIVGGIAYWLLMRDFQQSVLEQAFENFQSDVAAYLQTYGSLAEGERREPFPLFAQRHRRAAGVDTTPPPNPPLSPSRGGIPPFRFMLLDPDGRVIKAGEGYEIGQSVPKSLRDQARPISVNGKVAVLAVPLGAPNLSPQDLTYLAAMRRALVVGFLVAGSLALLFGLLFGRRMSATLDELAAAIRSMRVKGVSAQRVPVRTKDEIGMLAAAFNAMSKELAEAHDELREQSIRDPLTQLYNRRYFADQTAKVYEQAVRHNRPLSIMVGDIDHFKSINDNFSHAVGDTVLCRIAELLRENTRKEDILARHGGEEFVIAFSEAPLEYAVARCKELRRCIEVEPWEKIHEGLRVTISMGVSGGEGADADIETLLHEADMRLYEAKREGRNRVVSG